MKAKTTRRATRKARAGQLSDSKIEAMVLDLIEEHFDEKHRDAACEWLTKVTVFYQVFLEKEAKLFASVSPQGKR